MSLAKSTTVKKRKEFVAVESALRKSVSCIDVLHCRVSRSVKRQVYAFVARLARQGHISGAVVLEIR